ncbi:efflux RND transporter periplasmic adaptor subunit [Asinibacterium sp. OR53]|uniref:efflux RND transporter periplasmic adaptor subunit n=1 Tax=Asinibacterium sp. OR53 TaxID=925409 RepID=UPI0004BAF567|nr:efflux RND transporter periplasmic adaptor subunit [Asinibacterium sp. OR53]
MKRRVGFRLILALAVSLTTACRDWNPEAVHKGDSMTGMGMDSEAGMRKTPQQVSMPGMDMSKDSVRENVKGKAGVSVAGGVGDIYLSGQQVQLANIRTDTLRPAMVGSKLVLTGTLAVNQQRTSSVSIRVMGRIDRLYFKNAGDYVRKGDRLYDIYSEDLNNAKQELIAAVERKELLDSSVVDMSRLIEGAKYKLQLWGMSAGQIDEVVKTRKTGLLTTFYSSSEGVIASLDLKEGDYAMEGATLMLLADLSTIWVEAQVYSSQLPQIDRIGTAEVQIPDLPGKRVKGEVEFVNPEINADTRINLIRISIPNEGGRLKPGMPAYVFLINPLHSMLSMPIDAVIRDGKGATVWVQTGEHTFASRMVEVGMESGDRIEIRSGLTAGDIVVVNGAYLINSEYIFRQGANPMAGMKM